MHDYEKLGLFYLGRLHDPDTGTPCDELLLYDARDLVTHAVCVGMTGSGKTGLCIDLLEEAALDGIPAIVIDPKGDLGNLLLTFPGLSAAEFRPWIDEDEARRHGQSPDEFAASQAALWREGLERWHQPPDRIARFRAAADAVIYTPGSEAGIPLSVLRSFAAPPANVRDDGELLRERISTTVTGLLGLIGIAADPIRSREHILIATILDSAWRAGEDVDLARLIQLVQSPPVSRIGVLDLEAFYPSGDRFALATTLNNLLAAPGFCAWMAGEPLDIQRLLFTDEGRPRLAICSIAHLSDAERMFFVTLLLNEVLGWMRQQPGTSSLRAIVYMDEIAGYLPPVAVPPSKAPMLTLLKQARAFGVGLVLATQNPVDLDYKALSNAGTWFIGRLQTERDQARVLDGLEGAVSTAGGGFDRARLQRIIGGLGKRRFLLHNVHEDAPVVFESRWAMSYLRGPLTRAQIRTLMEGRVPRPPQPAAPPAGSAPVAPRETAVTTPPPAPGSARTTPPVLPPGIQQFFAPAGPGAMLTPMLLASAEVHYADRRHDVDVVRSRVVVVPFSDGALPIDWAAARPAPFDVRDLTREAPDGARFGELPPAASQARSYDGWAKSFARWLQTADGLELLHSAALKITSAPDEPEGAFRARVRLAAREARDAEVQRLRQKYAAKAASLEEKLRRARHAVSREEQQVESQKTQTAISFGTTLLGVLLGRKTLSASTLGRATTAARGMGRVSKEARDVERAKENLAAVERSIADLDAALQEEIAAVEARYDQAAEPIETVSIRPRRGGVHVQLTALVWMPAEN